MSIAGSFFTVKRRMEKKFRCEKTNKKPRDARGFYFLPGVNGGNLTPGKKYLMIVLRTADRGPLWFML
jgi:hypothetical protein